VKRCRGRPVEDDLFTKPSKRRWKPEELSRSVKYVFDEGKGRSFKTTEPNSILYRRYRIVEGLQGGVYSAIMKGADYISLRIIKEADND